MAGIYIHIPFCKQACHYCNFHFSTTLHRKGEMVQALLHELELQRDYLEGATLSSIYFGGGTPSLLSAKEREALFDKIFQLHSVQPDAEITFEANPDDLNAETLQSLRESPVNRLSIGIQSFFEEDLQLMNRAHRADQALAAIGDAQAAGFRDITADLIYGIPGASDARWADNIQTLLRFGIPHISAYCLTVEEGTALSHFVKKGTVPPVHEEQAARQFEILTDTLEQAGYQQYEISNFSLPGRHARHNSAYWLGDHYLGIGPSAHSYNGTSRQWNVANNSTYLRLLHQPNLAESWFETEHLSPEQRYHEQLMTGLRTIWGVDPLQFPPAFQPYFLEKVQPFIQQQLIANQNGKYILTRQGKLLADFLTSELF